MSDFTHRIHTEKNIDGFTTLDGSIRFFNFVKAILLKTQAKQVLDFGAGRGAALVDDQSEYRRQLRDLRTFGAEVTACDIDEVVLSHPCSSRQITISPDEKLPFENETFDVIVSDMTFEHIENPKFVAGELLRILKPDGYICARTPNRWGYVRFLTGLVPNWLHVRVLGKVQPDRKAEDVFPTVYKMNSPSQIRRLFADCEVYHVRDNAEPAYYFGNALLYRLFLVTHKLLPSVLSTTIFLFIKKRKSADRDSREGAA